MLFAEETGTVHDFSHAQKLSETTGTSRLIRIYMDSPNSWFLEVLWKLHLNLHNAILHASFKICSI